jgi:hypothetical protein
LVCSLGQFVRSIARAASKIENRPVRGVLLKVTVDTVSGRVINKIPFTSRKLLIPKQFLDIRWAVTLDKGIHKDQSPLSNIHIFIST